MATKELFGFADLLLIFFFGLTVKDDWGPPTGTIAASQTIATRLDISE